jgi:hypothetical protein
MSEAPYGQWTVAWSGMALLGIANGISRVLYEKRLGEHRAHQVSSATLVAALVPYTAAVERRWPLPTAGVAAHVGLTWVGLTTAFEFGFGHFVARQSWRALAADYDVARGRLWPFVLTAVGVAPAAARIARLRGCCPPPVSPAASEIDAGTEQGPRD